MTGHKEFEDVLSSLQALVEARRRRYLRLFYINSALAFALVVIVACCSGALLDNIAHGMGRTTPVSAPEMISFYFFTLICAASLVLLPVLRYQGSIKPEFALHRRIWQRLCEAMGDVQIMPRGAEYQHRLRAGGSFSASAGIAERLGIKGRAGGYQFWVQEVAINNSEGEAPFCGIAIFGRSDSRLHGDDNRRNYQAGIADHVMTLQGEAVPFQGFVVLAGHLPGGRQKICWDQKLLHRLQAVRGKVQEWFMNRHTKPALAAEVEYEAQFLPAPDLLAAYKQVQGGEQYPVLYLSLQGNDYVATLRCASPIFLNFSLFDPYFPRDKAMFMYELVQCVDRIKGESRP